MKKEAAKKCRSFIIREKYQKKGANVKEIMEKDIYGKVINSLG